MRAGFRADVQGLRALAVLVVIAFHAGLPLSGGFVGVDVFFVISGFVITAMLVREWDSTGSIALGTFYLRRVKRLTPALAVVVAFTAVVSTLFLSPFDQQEPAARTGLGALALMANWVIAVQSGDYFGPAAETNPLLHTWSLSVEEQFYLAFPITLLVAWRVGRRLGRDHFVALLAVILLGVASLAMLRGAALGLPADSWLIGYYSPLTRAWEFAAGAVLALIAGRLPRNKSLASLAGVAGVLLLAVSMTMIDAQTPFPGKWTLVPVLGATLCLAAGSMDADNVVSRLFALRPAVTVGDWSYSLYLWHWPLIVLTDTLFPLTPWAAPIAALLCFAPAVASYRWVEMPFRRLPHRPPRRLVSAVAAITVAAGLLAVGGGVMAAHVWKPAYETGAVRVAHPISEVQADLQEQATTPGVPCEWEELSAYIGDNGQCRQSVAGEAPDVVILGDSHAAHLYPGLYEALPNHNIAVTTFQSPYMFGTPAALDLALDSILDSEDTPTVVIGRYWTRGGLSPEDQLVPLRHAVRRLTDSGADVVLVDDVPDFPFPVSSCSYRRAPVISTALCDQPREGVDAGRDPYLTDLRLVAAEHPGTRVVEVGTTLCDSEVCSMLSGSQVAYSDPDHINIVGSRAVAARLVEGADLR